MYSGYASKLDMARMANAVQMALCGLEVWAHFEWVPPPLGREHLRYPVTDANLSEIPSRVDSVSGMEVTPELRISVVCISRHSSCRGVMEFRYAAVARQLASAAASASPVVASSPFALAPHAQHATRATPDSTRNTRNT